MAGVPGTGKTATLHEVIHQMRAKTEANESAPFRYIEINALRLATPQHAYVQLYRVRRSGLMSECSLHHRTANFCSCLFVAALTSQW